MKKAPNNSPEPPPIDAVSSPHSRLTEWGGAAQLLSLGGYTHERQLRCRFLITPIAGAVGGNWQSRHTMHFRLSAALWLGFSLASV